MIYKIGKNWDTWYKTEYWVDGQKFGYVTKNLTSLHKQIFDKYDTVTLFHYDKTVDFPFGLWTEIKAMKRPNSPRLFKAFPEELIMVTKSRL